MKFTTALSMVALLAPAIASPAAARDVAVVEARTGGGETCNNNQEQVCCASVVGLTCLIDILGGNCNGGSYCCDNGASTGGLINLNLLNCLKIQ